ncbi:hypothetical protein FJ695_13060 [Labrenzia sp. PHM005]|nr:hypothetical protein FJ695_13060 [Labrenzia sp. PHM005]
MDFWQLKVDTSFCVPTVIGGSLVRIFVQSAPIRDGKGRWRPQQTGRFRHVEEEIMPTKPQTQPAGPAGDPITELENELEALSKIGEAANLNDLVLGMSPAMAATSIYVSNANSLSILYENAVATQQQQTQLAQSALKAGIAQLQKITDSSSTAAATSENPDQDILSLLKALKEVV